MRTHHLFTLAALLASGSASAFCGFYVARADATLFNDRSEVILVRDGQRTIITMSNDFNGSVTDFAMVVPVPTVLQQSDIRIVERSVFSALDAYSSPRLVEYWDENPCQRWQYAEAEEVMDMATSTNNTRAPRLREKKAEDYGVTIEARYVRHPDPGCQGKQRPEGLVAGQWIQDPGERA